MDSIFKDLRFAVRSLGKNPGFSLVVVLILALGIGANSAIFTLVDSVLLRPLRYADSDRLLLLWETHPSLDGMSVAYLNFRDWQQQNGVFEHLAAYRYQEYNLTGREQPEVIQAAQVSASLFPALGIQPHRGRVFGEAEDRPGAAPAVVLSHGLWERDLGGDPEILDSTLTLNGQAFTVTGVMPPDFRFPPFQTQVQMWVPIGLGAEEMHERGNHPGIYVVGRLRPDVTLEQARQDMDLVAEGLGKQYPESNRLSRVGMDWLHARVVRSLRPALLLLSGVVAFVLLIVCANLANLFLARASGRSQEMALRRAIGAGWWRLLRQLLAESLVLTLLGGALGLAVAVGGVRLLTALLPANTPRIGEIGIDGGVLLFTLALAVLTGLIFGCVPAFQVSRSHLSECLQDAARTVAGGFRRHRLLKGLVVAQVACALVLLVGAGLMIQTLVRLTEADLGYEPLDVISSDIGLPESSEYDDAREVAAFYRELLQRLEGAGGIERASVSAPLLGGWQTSIRIEGTPEPAQGESDLTDIARVTPDHFRAMGIPLLRGRHFTEADRDGSLPVAIVDETLAERYWPGENPLGKRLSVETDHRAGEFDWRQVVGVVRHVKNYGADQESRIETYLPFWQKPVREATLVVRAAPGSGGHPEAIRAAVAEIDPNQPIGEVRGLEDQLDRSLAGRRMGALLVTLFAALGLLLAALGIYGILSYTVAQSTHEIGVRMALGARREQVLKLVLRHGLLLTVVGIALGLAGAFGLSRLISGLLYEVSATDPLTYLAVPVVLALAALAACLLPAWRAVRVDPMRALRYE